jgi:tetratricopeptide (TPR) repeat protein
LGGDHPGTLASRNNLALAYESAGRLGEAIELYEATLAEYERVLGGDHPGTLRSRNNLAVAYEHDGRRSEALAVAEHAFLVAERVLDSDHPVRQRLSRDVGRLRQSAEPG